MTDGPWLIASCAGCAAKGIHARCGGLEEYVDPEWYCYSCRRVVDVKDGGGSDRRSVRTVWGTARATRDGFVVKSHAEQKKELFRMVELSLSTALPTQPQLRPTNTAGSQQQKVVYGFNDRRQQDAMNVTLEDLILDGLNHQTTTQLLPPSQSPPRKKARQPRPSGDSLSSSSSPQAASSSEEDRLKASSPGDSDYESGKETTPAKMRANKTETASSKTAVSVACARESLDEKIERSIKYHFMEDKTESLG